MPVGGFLDSFPPAVFIAAHALFLLVGYWALRQATQRRLAFASAFWLYIAAQVVFLAMFGGVFTMKMAVLLDQTMMVVFVVLLVREQRTGA